MYSKSTKKVSTYVCDSYNLASSRKDYRVKHLLQTRESLVPRRCSVKVGIKSCSFHHFGENGHICHLCDKAFASKHNHQRHLLTHEREKSLLCNVHHIAFSNKRILKNHILMHKDVKSHACQRCSLKILLGTKGGEVCNSTSRTSLRILWHATGSKKKRLNKVGNKSFLHRVGIETNNYKYTGVKKYGCQVCRKSFVGKQKIKSHLLPRIAKKSHVWDVCDIAYSKKGDSKSRYAAYKMLNQTQNGNFKTCHASHNVENPEMCKVFNPAYGSCLKIASSSESKNHLAYDKNAKPHIYETLKNIHANEFKSCLFAHKDEEPPHIYDKFNRIQVSKLKNDIVAHKEKQSCVYKASNLVHGNGVKSFLDRKDEDFHIYEALDLIKGNKIMSIPVTHHSEESCVYETLNLVEGRELENHLKADKESSIYEALDLTEESEITCHLATCEAQESSPIYEELDLIKGSEIMGLLVTHQSEESRVNETLNLVEESEVENYLKTDKESNIYEALDLTEESEIKCHFVTYEAEESSPIYEVLKLAQGSDFATHIDEKLYLQKGPQGSNIKTHFASSKDEISPLFEVLNLTEEKKLKTPLIAHSNKNNLADDKCKRSFRQKLGPLMHNFKHTEMKYVCHVCDETFAVKFCFQSHLLTHPKKYLPISQVNIAFSEKGLLENHLSTHKDELHVCEVCGRAFAQESNYKTHLLAHKNVKYCLKVCNKNFHLKAGSKRRRFKRAVGKKFICHVCDKAFHVEWCFQSHLLTHQREPYHVCHVCHAAFSAEINLQSHLVTHTDEDSHIVGVNISGQRSNLGARLPIWTNLKMCYKYFPLKVKSKKYSFRHSGAKKHQCNECNKAFAFKWSLQHHLHTHSSVKLHTLFKKDSVENLFLIHPAEEPRESKECNQVRENKLDTPLLTSTSQRIHSKCFLPKEGYKKRRYKRYYVKKHKCSTCGEEFAMKLNLRRHLLTHANVNSHVASSEYSFIVHTEELDKPKVCNQSELSNLDVPLPARIKHNKYFRLKAKRKIYSFTLTRVKKHKCNVCKKSFALKWSLKRHQLAHTSGNSYECQLCHITFSEKVSLKSHLLTHGDEDPIVYQVFSQAFLAKSRPQFFQFIRTSDLTKHVCDICNLVFSRKVWLKVHNLKHIGAKKQVCVVCNKEFAMKWSLQRHLHTHNTAILEPIHTC